MEIENVRNEKSQAGQSSTGNEASRKVNDLQIPSYTFLFTEISSFNSFIYNPNPKLHNMTY